MKLFRILLSLVALVVAAVGVAAATGVIHWNASLVDLIISGGALLGTFGVAPLTLSLTAHRICAGIAAFTSAVVAAHASGAVPGAPKVFNVIAVAAALLSILGRWDAPVTPPVTPPAA